MKAMAEVYTEYQLDKAERFLVKLVTGLNPRSGKNTKGLSASLKAHRCIQGHAAYVLTETPHVFCQPADEKPDVLDLDNYAPVIIKKKVSLYKKKKILKKPNFFPS